MRGLAAGAAIVLWAASANAGAPAPARFTVTRTLPDGRTETVAITLEQLRAMMTPRAPAPPTQTASAPPPPQAADEPAPQTVVFALPPPIADPSPARTVAATPSAPTLTVNRLALNGRWVALSRDDLLALTRFDEPAGEGRASAKPKKTAVSLGVHNGAAYGDQGRVYLYAGMKNRGVGLNVTDHNGSAPGGWASDGVTYDKGGFTGQRSVGVGWRQGDVATSLGWVHDKTPVHLFGAPSEKDDRLALTFSWRPAVR